MFAHFLDPLGDVGWGGCWKVLGRPVPHTRMQDAVFHSQSAISWSPRLPPHAKPAKMRFQVERMISLLHQDCLRRSSLQRLLGRDAHSKDWERDPERGSQCTGQESRGKGGI